MLRWIIERLGHTMAWLIAKVVEHRLRQQPGLLERSPLALAYVIKAWLQTEYPFEHTKMRYAVFVRSGFPCLVIVDEVRGETYLVRVFA